MASSYPQDLLDTAEFLYRAPESQATLRRSISTAYYALFHLLISEACELWGVDEHRRFEHGQMKKASEKIKTTWQKEAASGQFPYQDLYTVASAFIQLQERRHSADYDVSKPISSDLVIDALTEAFFAFGSWDRIKTEK